MLTIEFEIEGQKFVALNGGPLFKFNESISFVVNCENQEEIDYFWGGNSRLTAERSQRADGSRIDSLVVANRTVVLIDMRTTRITKNRDA